MSVIRLYLDEDAMQSRLVDALRSRGIDAVSAIDVRMVAMPDEEHLRWATKEGRVLYRFNQRDFYQLHTQWIERGELHAGLILARQQKYSIGDQLQRLLRVAGFRSPSEMRGSVEFLSNWGNV